MKTFYILGGDERIQTVKNALLESGYIVLGDPKDGVLPDIKRADGIVCGLPMTGDGIHLFAPFHSEPIRLEQLVLNLREGQILFGGKIPEPVLRSAKKVGVKAFDYSKGEAFSVKNAVLTAEGAISLVIRYMKKTVLGARILVIGYGRIGTLLSERLVSLGAHVTVATGKEENFGWLYSRGINGVLYQDLAKTLPTVDAVLNTAPSRVVSPEVWKNLSVEIPLIELASLPGGFAGVPAGRVVSGAALPGKTSPVTAGIIIKDTILDIIMKEGIDA